jgi:hypothetical protein
VERHAGDREDRLTVELRVVEPIGDGLAFPVAAL